MPSAYNTNQYPAEMTRKTFYYLSQLV